MNILQNIRDFFAPQAGNNILHTPYGTLNLTKRSDQQKVKGIVASLIRNSQSLTKKDIGMWRQAWQQAIDVENPNRVRLLSIYTDTDADLHLTGAVSQRTGYVKSRSFKLVDKLGNENKEALDIFDSEWFEHLVDYTLESVYWGHSLIELGDVIMLPDGKPAYENVSLVPRQHVIPEFGRVITEQGQDWRKGISYREAPFTSTLIEVGKPSNLGLFLKASPQAIAKRNALGFWDTFGETFGIPMRVGRTSSRDNDDIQRMESMMQNMASELWAIFPDGMDFEIIANSQGDSFNVYDRRIDRANSEMSKLVIGQTMTIEDGSSLSQSETHLEVFKNLVDQDCTLIRNMVNNQLLPRMAAQGFPVTGLRFDWDYAQEYTPEQQLAYETAIADRYEVAPEYFSEKYNIPVGKSKSATQGTAFSFFD